MANKVMKTTAAMTCLQALLGIFTGIFWVVGAVLLGVGIYSKVKLGSYDLLSTMNYSSAPYVLIGIGVFIMLIGFLGCCAIGKGNTCMLRTYAFALAVMFVAEVALAIVVVVFRGKISESFQTGMRNAIKKYKGDPKYKKAVDNAQNTLSCCGAHNYSDYWVVAEWNRYELPLSCCSNDTACSKYTTKSIFSPPSEDVAVTLVYTKGCPEEVFNTVNSNLGAILGAMFGVAGFQLIGVLLACCLASNINSNKYELV